MIFEQIKKTPKIFFFYLYIVLQFIFYILLYTTNLFVYHLGCYSVIICGLIVSLFICLKYKVKYTYLLVFAQLFTLISDTFLVLLDDYYLIALSSFIIVQIFYYLYILSFTNFKLDNKHQIILIIRIAIFIIILGLFIFITIVDVLVFLALEYFAFLLFNFVESIFVFKSNILLPFGLFLFILCDLCVGCYNIVDIIDIKQDNIIYLIANFQINLSWIFYHPSQVILSLCGLLDKK